ncbi:MAG: hypothetical protein JXA20_04255 [Spirochaetes bacterium]|nr:hypothetical protein [Spirochaetota bacterium]
MKRLLTFGALMVVTAVFAMSVLTQEAETVRPCKADVDKFCKDIRPGHGRIAKCLKSHEAELSEACKAHFAEMREKGKGFMAACREDHRKYCKGVRPGQGRIINCLKSHEGELSEACRAQLSK